MIRNWSGKGVRNITNPPKHSPVPEALHRACCTLQSSGWGSFVSIQARSGVFAVLHSHLLIWVLISSCGCHFNQLWPLSCKKKNEGSNSVWFYFPPNLCFLWRVCVGIELQAFVHERWELFPLERCTWSRLRIWKHLFLEKALVCFHEEGLKNKSMKSAFFLPDQSGHHHERSFLIAPLCHVMSIPLSPLWQGKRVYN